MSTLSLKSQLARFWRFSSRGGDRKGFTLVELLIVTLIAGGLISGLMYLAVELLSSDQKDSARNETQREMQSALDYISADLRESVYVYSGECLGTTPVGSIADGTYCPGLANYIPATLTNGQSVPVLALWKQQPLPTEARTDCTSSYAAPPAGVPCQAGHSYALVIYSLSKANAGNPWSQNNARITRYVLAQFERSSSASAGYSPTRGYVDPTINSIFKTWPYASSGTGAGATLTNLQTAAGGRPTGSAVVLTDFVDGSARALDASTACPDDLATPAPDYSLSPPSNLLTGAFSNLRSFYACVSVSTDVDNRDVLINLRGNAIGRPGIINSNEFLPPLTTRVLTRGTLNKNPATQG